MNRPASVLADRLSALCRSHQGCRAWNDYIIDSTGLEYNYFNMTDEDIDKWNDYADQWEALSESEKESYGIMAALEQL